MPGYKHPIPIMAVNLATGERKTYPNIKDFADRNGFSPSTVRSNFLRHSVFYDWYFLAPEDEQAQEQRIKSLAEWWKTKGKRYVPMHPTRGLVSLRIDRHTVILVKPEKATEQYAEQYRQKLRDQDKKYLKSQK